MLILSSKRVLRPDRRLWYPGQKRHLVGASRATVTRRRGAAPAPTFNSFTNGTVQASAVNDFDTTLDLQAGTNRKAFVSTTTQNNVTFSGCVFDPGGANETTGVLVGQISRTAGTDMTLVLGVVAIPDGVTGVQTVRITKGGAAVTGLTQAVCWNDVGLTGGTAYDSATDEGDATEDLTLAMTKASADDLMISAYGIDANNTNVTVRTGAIRAALGTNDASGIAACMADDIAAAVGALDAGWDQGGGSANDLVGVAGLFPRLT